MAENQTVAKALELVKNFRDKARAILRLQSVNTLVENRQVASRDLAKLVASKATNVQRLAEIEAGNYSVDVKEAKTSKKSAADIIAGVKKDLESANADLDKDIERKTKNLEELDAEIAVAVAGTKTDKFNYRASKQDITNLANKLIENNHDEFELSDIDTSEEDAEDKPAL
ncbi:hypothetical protein M0R04_06560 [Candidatus Dojkabacteria bacterium]|jgi:hypothetical protein|nr:hypothetical protein [Candidatus Dojkabacteria bacterium]